MAKQSRSNKSAEELKAKIARSREHLGRDIRGLRYELDFSAKIRRSFQKQTGAWITAAAVVGTLIVLLPMRRKKIYVNDKRGRKSDGKSQLLEAGFLLGALRIAATLLKPAITSFLARKLAGFATAPRSSKKW
jgi:hypothetical protein